MPWRKNIRLYRNATAGNFVDITEEAGLAGVRGLGFSLLLFDFNRDRRLDLLVTAHAAFDEVAVARDGAAKPVQAPTARLFRGLPGGRFEEAAVPGLDQPFGTLQAVASDLDGDGWDDLILANGGLGARRLDHVVVLGNRLGRAFALLARLPGPRRPAAAIGASPVDIDKDGRPEIYLAGNSLFQQSPFAGGILLRFRVRQDHGR